MESEKLKIIREFEKDYHDSLYYSKELGEDGSWLKKPILSAISAIDKLGEGKIKILDFGCGPGRHSIPMAIKIQKEGGQVIGIDLLESAKIKFEENRKKFNIDTKALHFIKTEIENYLIPVEYFDYILSVSALEHVKNKQTLEDVIANMIQGTKPNGINYIIFSTDNYLYNPLNNKVSESMIEVNLSIDEAQKFFEKLYKNWEIIENDFIPWESIQIHTNEKIIQKGISYRFMAIKKSLIN